VQQSVAGDDGTLWWTNDAASSCSSFSSSFSSPVRPCISFLEYPVSGAVAAEDGALELLLLEAMKSVVKLVVTLVYCFPWSSLCASSAQDINDSDEDVRCCRLNGSLLPLFFVFSSVSLRRNRGTKVCSFLVRLCHFFFSAFRGFSFSLPLSPLVLPFLHPRVHGLSLAFIEPENAMRSPLSNEVTDCLQE